VATYRERRSLAPNKRPGSKPKLDQGARKPLEVDLKELLYLPPSAALPDLKPIKEAFAKVKVVLQRAEARTHEALIEAIGSSLDTLRTSHARASSSIACTALRPICCERRFLLERGYPSHHSADKLLAAAKLFTARPMLVRSIEDSSTEKKPARAERRSSG
jgi:hypothetical protein